MSSSYFKLPPRLRQRLQHELQPGERVMWAGSPDWRANWRSLATIFLFGSFWSAISGTFFVVLAAAALGLVPDKPYGSAGSRGWAAAFLVLLLPFVAIGLGLFWHIVRELRSGSRRVHAVTDRRVLTVEIGSAKPLDDRPLSEINVVRITERADGSGTAVVSCAARSGVPKAKPETITWYGIPDIAFVQATLDRRSVSAATATGRAPEQKVFPAAFADLPASLARSAERETRGERIDWVGRPDALKAAKWSTLVWIFALPWLYFTLTWELTSIGLLIQELGRAKTNTPIVWLSVMALWGIPFVAIGFSMLGLPLWIYRMAKSTAYIITDRRALSVTRRRGAIHVATIEPSRVVSISRTNVAGRGTISMVLGKTLDSDGDERDLSETFWLVQDAERAEQLIEALRTRDGRRAA